MQDIANLKEALCNVAALKMLDISDGAGKIVVQVDTSLEQWGAILQQEDENMDWHLCRYQSRLWINAVKDMTWANVSAAG